MMEHVGDAVHIQYLMNINKDVTIQNAKKGSKSFHLGANVKPVLNIRKLSANSLARGRFVKVAKRSQVTEHASSARNIRWLHLMALTASSQLVQKERKRCQTEHVNSVHPMRSLANYSVPLILNATDQLAEPARKFWLMGHARSAPIMKWLPAVESNAWGQLAQVERRSLKMGRANFVHRIKRLVRQRLIVKDRSAQPERKFYRMELANYVIHIQLSPKLRLAVNYQSAWETRKLLKKANVIFVSHMPQQVKIWYNARHPTVRSAKL